MAYVNPGELKHEVTFIVPQRSIDANGHYETEYAQGLTLRAAVRSLRAGDEMEYGAERAVESLQFILRYRRDLNSGMRLRFRGKEYHIESIDATPFAEGYMRIRAVSYDEGVGA